MTKLNVELPKGNSVDGEIETTDGSRCPICLFKKQNKGDFFRQFEEACERTITVTEGNAKEVGVVGKEGDLIYVAHINFLIDNITLTGDNLKMLTLQKRDGDMSIVPIGIEDIGPSSILEIDQKFDELIRIAGEYRDVVSENINGVGKYYAQMVSCIPVSAYAGIIKSAYESSKFAKNLGIGRSDSYESFYKTARGKVEE